MSLWFSWQELKGRKIVFFINLLIIMLLIALAVSLDLMGKAREGSILNRVDYIGPSLSLVPKGVRSSDLSTAQLKGRTFPLKVHYDLSKDFSSLLRASEARLLMNMRVGQREVPLVGMDFNEVYSYPFSQFSLRDDEVLIGSILARKLGKGKGDTIKVKSRKFMIAEIVDTTGGIDDISVFMSLHVLQELTGKGGFINEIRIYPRSSSSLDMIKSLFKKQYPQIDIVDSYRGEIAEEGIETVLSDYQKAVYAAAFVLIAICIVISTYINLDGRRSEISTIYTLGATKGIIFQILTLRNIWIAFLGSTIGQLVALLITIFQDIQVSFQYIWSWKSFAFVVLGTIILGLLVTTPFTIYSVFKRNLISHL